MVFVVTINQTLRFQNLNLFNWRYFCFIHQFLFSFYFYQIFRYQNLANLFAVTIITHSIEFTQLPWIDSKSRICRLNLDFDSITIATINLKATVNAAIILVPIIEPKADQAKVGQDDYFVYLPSYLKTILFQANQSSIIYLRHFNDHYFRFELDLSIITKRNLVQVRLSIVAVQKFSLNVAAVVRITIVAISLIFIIIINPRTIIANWQLLADLVDFIVSTDFLPNFKVGFEKACFIKAKTVAIKEVQLVKQA